VYPSKGSQVLGPLLVSVAHEPAGRVVVQARTDPGHLRVEMGSKVISPVFHFSGEPGDLVHVSTQYVPGRHSPIARGCGGDYSPLLFACGGVGTACTLMGITGTGASTSLGRS
jgi:hypothetical protein